MRAGTSIAARRALAPLFLLLASCTVGRIEATNLASAPPPAGQHIALPLRVHLADGTTIVFRQGATFDRDSIRGVGAGWLLGAKEPLPVAAVARGHVVAAESFRRRSDRRKTLLVNAPLIAAYVVLLAQGPMLRGCCP